MQDKLVLKYFSLYTFFSSLYSASHSALISCQISGQDKNKFFYFIAVLHSLELEGNPQNTKITLQILNIKPLWKQNHHNL